MVSFTYLFHILIFTGLSPFLTPSPAVLLIQFHIDSVAVLDVCRGSPMQKEGYHEQRTLAFETLPGLIHCFGVGGSNL